MVDLADIKLGWPVEASTPITQLFGENPNDYTRFGLAGHNGADFGCELGTPIRAAAEGNVMIAAFDKTGYGNYIKLGHGGYQTIYAHMSQMVKKTGQRAAKGEIIGFSGSTGNSTGPHLHFELRIPGHGVQGFKDAVDPFPYMEAIPSTDDDQDGSPDGGSPDGGSRPATTGLGIKVKVTAEGGLNVRLTPSGVDVGDVPFGSEL
jgi:murein DD-endopeptidase MepM/ murein hydrolase activator NlpD